MITMVLYAKIRRMYFRDKLSINEIVRRTSLSRNTVKKWLKQPEGSKEPKYNRKSGPTKLSPYQAQLEQALLADSHRPKRDRRTAKQLFEELKAAGYTGGYTQLTDFVRTWRKDGVSAGLGQAFVPLHFRFGEAFQFDWSEEGLVIGGIYRKLQVAHIKLCASRVFLLVAYYSQSHEMLFDAHSRAFQVFGGVPLRGIYDNMKTAVDKVQTGKDRIINTRFAALTGHYLFDPEFCNVASGWEKGIVEKHIQDSRRRLWPEASKACFGNLAELNRWLEDRCRALWRQLPYPGAEGLTLQEAYLMEQPHLMPMPALFDGYIEQVARVSSTCLVTVKRNRYSVPCHLARRRVSARLYPDRIALYADERCVASHARLFERDQVSYDWRHYLPLLERKPGALRNGAPFLTLPDELRVLQRLLLKRSGGDRVMVEVLASVPVFGLERVLEGLRPLLTAGTANIEHVRYRLARLAEADRHELTVAVPDALVLKEVPIADTGRYDSLNGYAMDQTKESCHD